MADEIPPGGGAEHSNLFLGRTNLIRALELEEEQPVKVTELVWLVKAR
ncbi:MAG: hypothetical protein ACE5F1_06640 [Planctomycetota bacterium]